MKQLQKKKITKSKGTETVLFDLDYYEKQKRQKESMMQPTIDRFCQAELEIYQKKMVDDDQNLRKLMNYSNPVSDDENCAPLKKFQKQKEKKRRKSLVVYQDKGSVRKRRREFFCEIFDFNIDYEDFFNLYDFKLVNTKLIELFSKYLLFLNSQKLSHFKKNIAFEILEAQGNSKFGAAELKKVFYICEDDLNLSKFQSDQEQKNVDEKKKDVAGEVKKKKITNYMTFIYFEERWILVNLRVEYQMLYLKDFQFESIGKLEKSVLVGYGIHMKKNYGIEIKNLMFSLMDNQNKDIVVEGNQGVQVIEVVRQYMNGGDFEKVSYYVQQEHHLYEKYEWLLLKFRYGDTQATSNKGIQTSNNELRYANTLHSQIKGLNDKLFFQEQVYQYNISKWNQEKQKQKEEYEIKEKENENLKKKNEDLLKQIESLKKNHQVEIENCKRKENLLEKKNIFLEKKNNIFVNEINKQENLTQEQKELVLDIFKNIKNLKNIDDPFFYDANNIFIQKSNSAAQILPLEDKNLFQQFKNTHLTKKNDTEYSGDDNANSFVKLQKIQNQNIFQYPNTSNINYLTDRKSRIQQAFTPPINNNQIISESQNKAYLIKNLNTRNSSPKSHSSTYNQDKSLPQIMSQSQLSQFKDSMSVYINKIINLRGNFSDLQLKVEIFKNSILLYQRYFNQFQPISQDKILMQQSYYKQNNSEKNNFWTAILINDWIKNGIKINDYQSQTIITLYYKDNLEENKSEQNKKITKMLKFFGLNGLIQGNNLIQINDEIFIDINLK